jgi:two-component system nitrogen regulation sensor histidine kinase NtrY
MSESAEPGSPPDVRRRWREAGIILATALAVIAFALFETRLPQFASSGSLGTDAILVLLINLNLILLVLLVFLVGRNLVKLFLDRRRRILGSHLRTRLVVAFIGIALLPATLLFLVAQVFVSNSIEGWFNEQVESALEGSLDVAHAYYEDLAANSLGFARQTAQRLAGSKLLEPGNRAALRQFLAERREEYQVDLLEVFADGQPLARSRRPQLPERKVGVEPWSPLVKRAFSGEEATAVDAVGQADVIRAAVPVDQGGRIVAVVVVDAWVPKSVVKHREEIDRSFGEYLRLKIQRRPIRTAYTITLVLVSLVVLFSATWVGLWVARGITVPIQRLAEGTRAVAQGDLDLRIPGEGDDELGTLVKAFNHMTSDIQASRAELDARRRALETVLANIGAGVIALDPDGRVTTINRAGRQLLGLTPGALIGRKLTALLEGDVHRALREEVEALLAEAPTKHEHQLALRRPDGSELAVLLTGSPLVDESGHTQGLLLFLEDVTHLLRVERMEAWREVARRIAHEIKNPLTPIQLAAQRLRRRYGPMLRDSGVFDECTRTIVQQVEDLKALVNEFQTFARMPQAEHTLQDLNRVVDDALVLFREGHPAIDFVWTPAADLPPIELDREGLKRAIINILDNAVAACTARPATQPGERRRVTLSTAYDAALGIARLEIADDGVGISPEARARLFEPYYSTKPEGTGLGLAIVQAIVADHKGFIRVREDVPHGTRFVLEFPVRTDPAQLVARARHGAYGS